MCVPLKSSRRRGSAQRKRIPESRELREALGERRLQLAQRLDKPDEIFRLPYDLINALLEREAKPSAAVDPTTLDLTLAAS